MIDLLLAFSILAFPVPRFLFGTPDDSGAGTDPVEPSGIDAEIEAAMKMTEDLSDPDHDPDDDPVDPPKEEPAEGDPEPPSGDDPEPKDPPKEDEPQYNDEFDPNDVVEVDGSKYFYHPKVHAPDASHGNVYRSRDDAEIAWTHKVNRIHELASKLNELGKGIGPADLPEWFGDPENLEALKQKADVEEAIGLPNGKLRERLKEGDNLITYLDSRLKRIDEQVNQQKVTDEIKQKVDKVYKAVNPLIDELGILSAVQQASDAGDASLLVQAAKVAIEKKIASEIKPLEKEYQDYKSNVDARLDDEDYADKLEKKRDAILEKRSQLERKYADQYLAPFNELVDVEREVSEFKEKQKASAGMSEKERLAKVNEGFLDLQAEMAEKHPIFLATDSTGANAFREWAVKRSEKFGGLLSGYQWGQALKAFDKHIEERRAEVRRKQVEGQNKKDAPPAYGNQEKLTEKKPADAREKLDAEIEALMEETEAHLNS